MLVKDLIAKLQDMPQDLSVVIDGYEGGVGGIKEGAIRQAKMYEDINTFPYKMIDNKQVNKIYYNTATRNTLPTVDVVYISRFSLDDRVPVFDANDCFGIHEIVEE